MNKLEWGILLIGAFITTISIYMLFDAASTYPSVPKLPAIHIIKDSETKCQYITAHGAMYPRLDDRKHHICSDDAKKYTFDAAS